jgi:hypothetical protein
MREIYMVPEIISEAAGGKIVQEISKVQATTLGMVTAGIVQGTSKAQEIISAVDGDRTVQEISKAQVTTLGGVTVGTAQEIFREQEITSVAVGGKIALVTGMVLVAISAKVGEKGEFF